MKKQLLILVMMLMPIAASADAVVIDGIYYNLITKGGANVAEVTKNTGDYRGNVVIPSSITYEGSNYLVNAIGKEAFYFCTELNSVSIPESIESIGSGAFYMCTGLTSVHISNLKAWCNIKFIKDSDFYEYFCNPLFYTNHLYLNNEEILHLDIPEGVISINNYAFYNCSNFTSITFPSSVTSIGNHAFENCSGLVSANFNEGTTTIGDYAFQNCNSLESLTLPNSITTIGQGSFRGCNGLTLLKMGNSINTIAKYAFDGCSKLTSLVLPNSVSTIRESAFANCSLLQSLTFGKSVSSIYSYAFSGCPELTDVYCLGNFIQGVNIDAFNGSYIEYATLHVPELLIDIYSSVEPWKNFKNIVRIKMPEHTLTYIVDEDVYKTYQLEEGESITPEPAPTKEGYTFSGWSEIPETMPSHDVTVTGSFSINSYKLTYVVDGVEYKTVEVEYNSAITPEAEPTKEGHTFSGWSEIPEAMPANDVTVTGSFTINNYTLTYMVDGEVYKTSVVDYGTTITPEAAPTKTGYIFSGWDDVPLTMPARDVTVNGTFAINSYKLTYIVDGEEYKTFEIVYDSAITPEAEPTKEGHTFSGWSEIPKTMPANDVTVTGSFIVNKYQVTYIIDGEMFATDYVEYGATIVPPTVEEKEGFTFSGWEDLPEIMPAHNIVVHASYTSGIIGVLMASQQNLRIYSPNGKKLDKLQKGLNIILLNDDTVKKIIVK